MPLNTVSAEIQAFFVLFVNTGLGKARKLLNAWVGGWF
jgi:hypothetical protein